MNISNVIISNNVYGFTRNYIANNKHDRSYADDTLYEYYPNPEEFVTNFEFKSVAIGVLPTGNLIPHVDDERDSVFIIPITEITILDSVGEIVHSKPFILDTTIIHSSRSKPNTVFIGFDFHMSYYELKEYFKTFEHITIDVRKPIK